MFSVINPILNSNQEFQTMNNLDSSEKVNTLLYGNNNLDYLDNKLILNATIEFIRSTERFA